MARLANRPPFGHIFFRTWQHPEPGFKIMLSRIPGWPALRFCQAYFFNLGFTEGAPGFIYCANIAWYEFQDPVKMREIKKQDGPLLLVAVKITCNPSITDYEMAEISFYRIVCCLVSVYRFFCQEKKKHDMPVPEYLSAEKKPSGNSWH